MAPQTKRMQQKRKVLTQIPCSRFWCERFVPNKLINLQVSLQVQKAPSPVLGSDRPHDATALPREETSRLSHVPTPSPPVAPSPASGPALTRLRSALIPLDDSSMLKDVRSCLLVPEGPGKENGWTLEKGPRKKHGTGLRAR